MIGIDRKAAVAVCCSWASLSSRVSRATSVSWPAGEELRWRTAFRAFALRLRALASLLLWSAVASPTQGLGLRRYQGGITAGICGRRNGVQYKFAERSLSAFGHLQFRARAGFTGDGCCVACTIRRVSIRYLVGVKRRLRTIFGRSGLRRCGGRHPELVVFADDSKNLCYNARMQSR